MSKDIEMNDVKVPLMVDNVEHINDVKVPDVEFKAPKSNDEFTGLSKEELEKYAKDPFWRKLRLILFVLFWLVWLGMLVIAILIVVLSPKCPKTPKLEFWNKKTGYWVDAFAFADSNGDGVGDFEGLISRLDYIQNKLGAGYIVLDPIFKGQYSDKNSLFGSVKDFKNFDESIGDKTSFMKLLKESRKRGIEIILTVDFNSLSKSSEFFKNNPKAAMKWDSKMESWVSRDGENPKDKLENQDIYKSSSKKSNMIDLDLKEPSVLQYIKDSVKMWLNDGIRGLLLTNVALYVENTTVPAIPTNNNLSDNKWYHKTSMNGQIFSLDTRDFLKEIRLVMNEVAKATDKSRCLIIDAGNVGYGLSQSTDADVMMQYLDGPERIADMVVGREFLRNRGWNVDNKTLSKSSVEMYLQKTDEKRRNRIALTSATSTSLRTSSLQKMAAPFLLPGNPLLYYGSEIGEECDIDKVKAFKPPFYPENRDFELDDVPGELTTKCNHMVMPWDSNGKVFSSGNKTVMESYVTVSNHTIQGLLAVGREKTVLQLHQKLIKIRNEPSLQWGEIKPLINEKTSLGAYEIFIREAEGFPKIIVALIQDTIDGKVFDLSSVCEKFIPILVYPENPNLPEDKEVKSTNIYLKVTKNESVHVFKCVS